MSMPHECVCRICGGPLTGDQSAARRAVGARALASAILKIAPDQARVIAERWQQMTRDESRALEEFLTFLREPKA